MRQALAGLVVALGLAACDSPDAVAPATGTHPAPPQPVFVAEARPATLSDWGQLAVGGGALVLGEGVTPYALNTALFTDYAHKLRTVWIPPEAGPAAYDARETFAFPVGTVITKTFYYPRAGGGLDRVARTDGGMAHFDGQALDLTQVRLIETRVLVHRETGWEALPYVWDEDQQTARLARTGAVIDLTLVSAGGARALSYLVPNANQCAGCHVTDTSTDQVRPIGPRARHLNGDFAYFDGVANQLDQWSALGLLAGAPAPEAAPQAVRWPSDTPLSGLALEAAARSYLDINCAHCHSRTGPADTSGLYLEPWEPTGPNLGVCKPPIAAGRGTGNRRFGIVPGDADASILAHRMESEQADIMMPELGRDHAHEEGVALIAAWIDAMSGGCG